MGSVSYVHSVNCLSSQCCESSVSYVSGMGSVSYVHSVNCLSSQCCESSVSCVSNVGSMSGFNLE